MKTVLEYLALPRLRPLFRATPARSYPLPPSFEAFGPRSSAELKTSPMKGGCRLADCPVKFVEYELRHQTNAREVYPSKKALFG